MTFSIVLPGFYGAYTDVLRQSTDRIFKVQSNLLGLLDILKMGRASCAETLINNVHCVTSQKSEDLIDVATDDSNHAVFIFDDIWCRHAGVLN